MAAPHKDSDELRERAVRMVVDARRDPETRQGAIARIAGQLGINAETLRTWVKRTEIDEGSSSGTTSRTRRGSPHSSRAAWFRALV